MMAGDNSFTTSYTGSKMRQAPYQSYSVLRSKFDRWFAQQAEKMGAMLVTKSRVDELIKEDGKVIGVRAGGDELGADVIVAADGVLSLLSEKVGLSVPANPEHYAVGFKEIIELDRSVIENRFGLEGNEGAARLFMGEVTRGKFGGGFLYTNQSCLSLGIVVGIKDLMQGDPGVSAPQLMDDFKMRTEVANLIKGGQTVEYSAHVIPEGGLNAWRTLYGDGIVVVGDAAGMAMNIGVTVRGMEYALASGYYAAQAILKARESKDFSRNTLKEYQALLEKSFVYKDFKNFQEAPKALENPRFFNHYPEMVGSIMQDIYTIPAGPKDKLMVSVKKQINFKEILAVISDMRKVMKI